MAEFNVDVGNIPSSGLPDFTGASRGATPNRAFETLFSGIGDTIGGVATLADRAIKENIKTDVKSGYETLNEPLDSIPPELQNSTQSMQALQTAYEQGKISDTYYYGTLNAQLKALRTKYPGYEDFVDETMQSVTGVRPANAFRNALLSEINQMQNDASDVEKQWAAWEKQNEQDIVRVFPDYFTSPGKYSREEVRAKTVALKGQEAGIAAENANINYLLNQGKLSDEAASEAATTALIQQANTFLSATSNTLGFDSADFMARIANAQSEGFTPEEYQGLVGQLSVAEAQLRSNLLRIVNNPLEEGSSNSFASILGSDATNKLVDDAMAQFNLIKQMVVDENFGMAGYYTRLNQITSAKDTSAILNASPEIRLYNRLAEVDPALAQIWLQEGSNQESVLAALGPELMARFMSGDDTFTDALRRNEASTQTPEEKSALANTLLDSSLVTITSGVATPEQMSTAVDNLYALDDEGRDIFNMVTPEEYSSLYHRMFNPSVTQALVASGDTLSLQKYYESARERLTAIPEFARIAANVQDKIDWSKGITVQFNPQTGRLQVQADQSQSAFGNHALGNIGFRNVVRGANEAVNELNNIFSTFSPILTGLGVDEPMKSDVYREILNDLRVNVENGKQEGFFDWLGKQVQNEIDIFNNSDATKAIGGIIQDSLQQTSDAFFGNDEDITFNFDPISERLVEVGPEGFEDPSTSPKVNPDVIEKFSGKRLPVSIRNNNMGAISITGNIEDSWAAQQPGFIGVTNRPAAEGGYYAKFATPEDGIRAASNLLIRYGNQGINTPSAIVKKWSTDTNAHTGYANTIVDYLQAGGYDVDATTALDLNDPSVRLAILMAKSEHESGAGRPVYTSSTFTNAIQ